MVLQEGKGRRLSGLAHVTCRQVYHVPEAKKKLREFATCVTFQRQLKLTKSTFVPFYIEQPFQEREGFLFIEISTTYDNLALQTSN